MDVLQLPLELIERYDRPGPRYTSYPTVPAWSASYGPREYAQALGSMGPHDSLALYVHFPFCAAKCLYCGCNMTVTRRAETIDRYLDALEREVDAQLSHVDGRRTVTQMHWGGGTPNHLSDSQLWRAFECFNRRFDIAADAELSVEADPRLVSRAQLAALRAMGFNRISFGVQDVDPEVQEVIGRRQSLALVRDACEAARAVGFQGLNVDVMYGLPLQTPARFVRTLMSVADLEPDRIACFGYAHVPWMRPHQRAIDAALLPTAPERFTLFRLAVDAFEGRGYQWIGLDHFARRNDPLSEAQRAGALHRNFMGYTVMPADHLLAFGMSGISEVGRSFAQSAPTLREWHTAVDGGALPIVRGLALGDDDVRRRDAIMRLMCNLEMPLDGLEATMPGTLQRLQPLEEDRLVTTDAGTLRVTPLGRYFLRNVCMAFDAYLPAAADGDSPRFSRAI
jgi:oxygen-independent coproporphyrinogen-3 oxidase